MKDTNQKKRANGTPKIVAIVGPTASDKTKLAIALAKKFNGELISADSRQIFKGMDIGTNKDKSYPQHLIDIVNPDEEFSVAQFQKMAYKLIGEILKRGKLPILVGGTGLYIDAVLYGYSIPPKTKESARLRQELERQDAQALWRKLQKLDSKSAVKIGPHNKQNCSRAGSNIAAKDAFFPAPKQAPSAFSSFNYRYKYTSSNAVSGNRRPC